MLSRRLQWHSRPNKLADLLAAKRSAGDKILDLTESNPTRAGFEYPSEEILGALASPVAMAYEPSPRGLLQARTAISAYYSARGATVAPSRILLTASTSEAYSFLFQLLADPGDEILCPRPSYPLFEYLAALATVSIQQYPLRYDGGWHVDFEAMRARITPRTRAVAVVHPNNPTGTFLKAEEIERLEGLAAEHDLAIVSDEVFCDYSFDPAMPRGAPRTLAGERKALTFSMNGLSKAAGLPQLKLGWIAASGPGWDAAMEALELISDTYLSVSTPVQAALPRLLKSAGRVREQIAERVARNRATVTAMLKDSPGGLLAAEGGWYAVVQVPNTRTEENWCLALLRDREVAVQPGYFFDFETEAYLVLSLLTDVAVFREGVRRIRDVL